MTQPDAFDDTPADEDAIFSTRDYQPADAPALAALYRAAILEATTSAYSPEQCAAWAASADDAPAWAARLQENWVRVAIDDTGEIIGFGGILMPGYIDLLYTLPDAQRMGVASLILHDLLGLAAAMGARQISSTASEPARPLFEKAGFKLQGTEQQTYGTQSLQTYRLQKTTKR